jgi:TolA-binding protein
MVIFSALVGHQDTRFMELSQLRQRLKDLRSRIDDLRGYL